MNKKEKTFETLLTGKERETITLYLDDFETISHALDTVPELDHPEFFHEEVQDLINSEDFGIAGYKLIELQDKIDAVKIIKKINDERKKIDEKKTSGGLNS